mmetsp:Transcript_2500/g.5763  ORF Transcript_2500/g.5763 Transcript_2500/m.5763 type:complete len:465 (-) Transcript_2500:33-1427(-)
MEVVLGGVVVVAVAGGDGQHVRHRPLGRSPALPPRFQISIAVESQVLLRQLFEVPDVIRVFDGFRVVAQPRGVIVKYLTRHGLPPLDEGSFPRPRIAVIAAGSDAIHQIVAEPGALLNLVLRYLQQFVRMQVVVKEFQRISDAKSRYLIGGGSPSLGDVRIVLRILQTAVVLRRHRHRRGSRLRYPLQHRIPRLHGDEVIERRDHEHPHDRKYLHEIPQSERQLEVPSRHPSHARIVKSIELDRPARNAVKARRVVRIVVLLSLILCEVLGGVREYGSGSERAGSERAIVPEARGAAARGVSVAAVGFGLVRQGGAADGRVVLEHAAVPSSQRHALSLDGGMSAAGCSGGRRSMIIEQGRTVAIPVFHSRCTAPAAVFVRIEIAHAPHGIFVFSRVFLVVFFAAAAAVDRRGVGGVRFSRSLSSPVLLTGQSNAERIRMRGSYRFVVVEDAVVAVFSAETSSGG